MANVISKATGSKAIQAVLADGSRVTIGIGRVPKKAAESYRIQIEHLVSASAGGYSIPTATAEWLTTINLRLRSRLEKLKLVEPAAEAQEDTTTSRLIDKYLSELATKPRTVTRYRNQTQFLRDFAGGKSVSELTAGDGDRFLKWLRKKKKKNGEPYAPNYISKIVKTSRQVFAYGAADNLLSVNPLAGVSAPERIDEERDYEITPEMTEAILQAANPKYRLIIALARYGGLRCPSELIGLRWSHILWDKDRFTVLSPKTEHCGKAKRLTPIFPELRRYLLEAQEIAPEKEDRVFSDIHEDTNLRTELDRILARAGVTEDVPRFFQNCRSSRQTELEADYPLHVVCRWLGNTESTARRHYLKVQEKHFAEAASAGMHQSMQKMSAEGRNASQPKETTPAKRLERAVSPAIGACGKYTRKDSNLQPSVPKTDALSS